MKRSKEHSYAVRIVWTGNQGSGTSDYGAYSRRHEISARGKPAIAGSSDPAFRGDADAYNPEELLVASLASCHMLWYLHLCADAGIVVTSYADEPIGQMWEEADGGGRFTEVVLRPAVCLDGSGGPDRIEEAGRLHQRAHDFCFISRSVRFPVRIEPVVSNPTAARSGDEAERMAE